VQTIDVHSTRQDDGWVFEVTVSQESGHTKHRVTMARDVYERLTGTKCPPEELVRRSFEYLLEREPKESILSEFDITVISRYFPSYEEAISRRIRP
jgi:hypothetical protein